VVERASLRASRAAWKKARSFAELCELAARFVEGRIAFFPGWNPRELDGESDAIAPLVARACRAGFLTVASQPARAPSSGNAQRAFVCGFARRSLARALGRDVAPGLVLVRYGCGWRTQPLEPEDVSLHGRVAHAFTGHDARNDEYGIFADCVSPAAFDELRGQAWVSFHDEKWGRKRALWKHIERVLGDEGAETHRAGARR
jgi:hypothetical protein